MRTKGRGAAAAGDGGPMVRNCASTNLAEVVGTVTSTGSGGDDGEAVREGDERIYLISKNNVVNYVGG